MSVAFSLWRKNSMGLFDYFQPVPQIGCARPGCTGSLHGWQGKHDRHCLFVWQQGHLAPVDQSVDEEIKLPLERLASKRLPANAAIPAAGATCDRCSGYEWFSIECITDSQGLWTETKIVGKTASSKEIENSWLQCQNCFDAWPVVEGKTLYRCPSCEFHHSAIERVLPLIMMGGEVGRTLV